MDADTDKNSVTEAFQNKLLEAEEKRDVMIEALLEQWSAGDTDSLFSYYANQAASSYKEEGIEWVVYKNSELVFWSDNSIAIPYILPSDQQYDRPFIFLDNGWYDVKKVKKDDLLVIGFILIERKYSHENQYLKNEISNYLDHPAIIDLEISEDEAETAVFNSAGTYLFSLVLKEGRYRGGVWKFWMLLSMVLSMISFIKVLEYLFIDRDNHYSLWRILLFILQLGIFRWLMIQFHFPAVLYETIVFDPALYAHSYLFPSIGDLLFNALFAIYIAYLLMKSHFSSQLIGLLKGKYSKVFMLVVGSVVILMTTYFVTQLLRGGVENSTINYDVSNVFKLSFFSYLGLTAFGVFFFVLLMILDKLIDFMLQLEFQPPLIIATYSLLALLIYPIIHTAEWNWYTTFESFWTLPIFISIVYFKSSERKNYSFSMLVALVLLFAITASVIIVEGSSIREMNHRKYLAGKLSTNTDPVAEYLFNDLKDSIAKDSLLQYYLVDFWTNEQLVKQRMMQKYFSGYWDKYDFQFVGCTQEDSVLITTQNISDHCFTYFNFKISDETEPTAYPELFHVPHNNANPSYIGQIRVMNTAKEEAILFVEFRSKPFIKSEGYPELLLGQKELDRTLEIEDYSFARYQDGYLVTSIGDYHYPLELADHYSEVTTVFKNEDYSHLLYQTDFGTTILLSRNDNKQIQIVVLFSFLFSLFSLFFFLFSLTIADFPVYYSFSFLSFGSKLQLILVGVILIVIIPFGIGVAYYIQMQYQQRTERNLTEKIRSVLTEVEHKIGNEEFLPTQMPIYFQEYLDQILIKFSNVFYTDINLYGLNGQLLATSRNEVFDTGLRSKQMDVNAYEEMILNQKSFYIHNENIGALSYHSAYAPFRNNENDLLAYLNLPYFAKQNELEKEIGGFLVTLINSYIFLIALAIIMAVVFADYLSRPLKLISSKIGQLKLGSENELIQWEGDDEIGVLVNEYNRMVKELAKNVQLLAKSEREGAWREMAKQVAHEIKNPLTPMKLSVQHLNRAFDAKDENSKEQVTKVCNTLIEQIDSLTHIANEFSNFAKMPATKKELLNIKEVVESSMNLFKEENVQLSLDFDPQVDELVVQTDRDQLMRAFNNIIKNAIQSIAEGKKGLIEISIQQLNEHIEVQIKDNGKGIHEDEQYKIFTPSFTTKSGGMGLGLAMVKSIIENSNGTVSFDSKVDVGTIFYVKLPVYQQ